MLLELKDCNREILNDLSFIKDLLSESATRAGATVLGESFHKFNPHGVSGVVVIAESHISIHTWPEHGYAAVDIFSCGTRVDTDVAAQAIIKALESKNHSVIEIQRGIL